MIISIRVLIFISITIILPIKTFLYRQKQGLSMDLSLSSTIGYLLMDKIYENILSKHDIKNYFYNTWMTPSSFVKKMKLTSYYIDSVRTIIIQYIAKKKK